MATPATITNVYSVTKSKKNEQFYVSAGAVVAGSSNSIGESAEEFRLVDIALKNINETIKSLLEQEPIVTDKGNLRFLALNKDTKLDIKVSFKSMTQKESGDGYWVSL